MERPEVSIRLASYDDLTSIEHIEKVCFPQAEAATQTEFEQRFRSFGNCFLVALVNEQVVGFVNGCTTNQPLLPDELYHDASLHYPDGHYQTVFGLDVLPEYQHNKIGAKLMNAFIALAKQRNKKGMVLTCKDHLVPYYESFGFIHQGVSSSSHGGAKWNDMLLEF